MATPSPRTTPAARRTRSERGVAFPSPLVMLSVIAIAMAGITFVATKDQPTFERRISTTAQPSVEETTTPAETRGSRDEARKDDAKPEKKKPKKKPEPKVVRGETYVVVFNNSGISGLAATYASQAGGVGWQVVGEDNWVGTIPASTVYYPARLEAAAKLLALDLGIGRVMPAVAPMQMDRLTLILTADAV